MLAGSMESQVAESSTQISPSKSAGPKWTIFLGLTLLAIAFPFFKSIFLAEPISRFDLITQLDVLFNPHLNGSGITVAQDPSACLQSIPREYLVQEQLRHFVLPLWNNLSGCGKPILADPANTIFGPIDLIFSPLNQSVYNIGLIFKMLLGGALSFWLFTRYGANPWAASTVAVGFALCARVLRGIELATDYEVLPAIFLAFSFLTPRASMSRIAGCSLMLAFAYVSLHPEVFFVGVLSASIIWFSNFYSALKDKKRVLKRAFRSFIVFGIISILIVSPFLLAFFEYLKLAQSYKYHDASMQFIPIDQLLKYLCDAKLDGTLFPGWLVIFGALASLCFKWKQKWSVMLVAAVWILFSCRPMGLIQILGRPPLSYLLPEYGLGCILLMVCTMAALGLTMLRETSQKKCLAVGVLAIITTLILALSAGLTSTKLLLLPSLALVASLAIIFIARRNKNEPFAKEPGSKAKNFSNTSSNSTIVESVSAEAADIKLESLSLPEAESETKSESSSSVQNSDPNPRSEQAPNAASNSDSFTGSTESAAGPRSNQEPQIASKASVSSALNSSSINNDDSDSRKRMRRAALILLPAINAIFMFAAARHELPATRQVAIPPSGETEIIEKLRSYANDRVTACGDRIFQPETNLLYGISDLRTCSPLNNTRYLRYMEALGAKLGYCNMIQLPTELNHLLDMASVKHIVSDEPPVDIRAKKEKPNLASDQQPALIAPGISGSSATTPSSESASNAETRERTEGRIMPGLRLLKVDLSGAAGLASVNCKITLRAHKHLGSRYAIQVLIKTDSGELISSKAQTINTQAVVTASRRETAYLDDADTAEPSGDSETVAQARTHNSEHTFHMPLSLTHSSKQLLLRIIDTWTGSRVAADGKNLLVQDSEIVLADKSRLDSFFDVKGSGKDRFSVEFESPTMHRIYANNTAVPSAYIVHHLFLASNGNEALKKICEEEFDYKNSVVLETYGQRMNLDQLNNTSTHNGDRVVTLSSSSMAKAYQYTSKQAGIFVVTDCYYPGWRAEVDGKSTGIYRSNFLFQSIFVPAGTHQVKFYYSPSTIIASMIISAIISLLCVALTIQGIMRYRSSKK